MQRLRAEEERRQYERMINPPPASESFSQRFPNAGRSFPSNNLGPIGVAGDVDDVTYADINRQMTLIINVLVSIICCSIAIWIAARRWDVPQRLGLSMSGSGLVAAAEVAIYMGYIRRIKDAKGKETKSLEKKEIVETWVLDGSATSAKSEATDSVRFRKGKHR
jgi:TMEM199 family protein